MDRQQMNRNLSRMLQVTSHGTFFPPSTTTRRIGIISWCNPHVLSSPASLLRMLCCSMRSIWVDMGHIVEAIDEQPDPIPTRWLNAMLGRLFFSVYRTDTYVYFMLRCCITADMLFYRHLCCRRVHCSQIDAQAIESEQAVFPFRN